MTEKEIIDEFWTLSRKIPEIDYRIKRSDNPRDLISEKSKLEQHKESIISQIKAIEDKTLTNEKIENVRTILKELLDKFSKRYPYKLSRDQSTVIHGYIYCKIVADISDAFRHDLIITSEYYFEKDSDFDCSEIIQILEKSVHYIDNIEIHDYIELFDFANSIQKQIIDLDPNCGKPYFN